MNSLTKELGIDMEVPHPPRPAKPATTAIPAQEAIRVIAVEIRGNDLICALSDGRTVAADWRQLWTYRRMEHGDNALSIASHALIHAPDLFSMSHARIKDRNQERMPPWSPHFWSAQLHKGISLVTTGIARFAVHLKAK